MTEDDCHVYHPDAEIGFNCKIHNSAELYPGIVVGSRCKIQGGAYLFRGVILEDDVFIGPCVCFTNVINPRAWIPRMDEIRRTLVKRGAKYRGKCYYRLWSDYRPICYDWGRRGSYKERGRLCSCGRCSCKTDWICRQRRQ